MDAVSSGGTLTFIVTSSSHPVAFNPNALVQQLSVDGPNLPTGGCKPSSARYFVDPARVEYVRIYQQRDGQTCYGGTSGGCISLNTDFTIESKLLNANNQPAVNLTVKHHLGTGAGRVKTTTTDAQGIARTTDRIPLTQTRLYDLKVSVDNITLIQTKVPSTNDCSSHPLGCITSVTNVPISPASTTGSQAGDYKICDQIPENLSDQRQKCIDCVGGDEDYGGIWTAIGCIPNDPETIVKVFLRFGLGMGGGIALLMILGAGFMLTVSQGDPKQTDTAKQWIASAIAGLLFIIFSVTILQFIGYNVFQIPGFGG